MYSRVPISVGGVQDSFVVIGASCSTFKPVGGEGGNREAAVFIENDGALTHLHHVHLRERSGPARRRCRVAISTSGHGSRTEIAAQIHQRRPAEPAWCCDARAAGDVCQASLAVVSAVRPGETDRSGCRCRRPTTRSMCATEHAGPGVAAFTSKLVLCGWTRRGVPVAGSKPTAPSTMSAAETGSRRLT